MISTSQFSTLQRLRFLLPLLLLSVNAFSQGEFLHRGQSGIQLDGFIMESKKIIYADDQGQPVEEVPTLTGYGGKFGFSIRGVFDIQWRINALQIPATGYEESTGTMAGAQVVLHALKQSDKVPFSLRLFGGLMYYQIEEVWNEPDDYYFGAGIYRRVYLRDNISINPTLDLGYRITNHRISSGDDMEASDGFASFSLPISFNVAGNHLLHLAPFFNYGFNATEGGYGINLGYMIPFYLKRQP